MRTPATTVGLVQSIEGVGQPRPERPRARGPLGCDLARKAEDGQRLGGGEPAIALDDEEGRHDGAERAAQCRHIGHQRMTVGDREAALSVMHIVGDTCDGHDGT